mmetsp:Transcript_126236/g.404054  ORF Transcript_126236/g.404054 Transcript_126236/m.404054 type:complete len:264 (+) Transcript_126236:334-1125(+)
MASAVVSSRASRLRGGPLHGIPDLVVLDVLQEQWILVQVQDGRREVLSQALGCRPKGRQHLQEPRRQVRQPRLECDGLGPALFEELVEEVLLAEGRFDFLGDLQGRRGRARGVLGQGNCPIDRPQAASHLHAEHSQTPHVGGKAVVAPLGRHDGLRCREGQGAARHLALGTCPLQTRKLEATESRVDMVALLFDDYILGLDVAVTDLHNIVQMRDRIVHLHDETPDLVGGKWPSGWVFDVPEPKPCEERARTITFHADAQARR